MLPLKISSYIFNVSDEEPEWEFHHELTSYYDMEDLSPSSFDNLSSRMLQNESLAIQY